MKRIPLFLFTALLLLGCSREEYSPSETFPSGGKFTFTVSPMKGETQTKSSFASGTGLLRTSIYMLAYQNGALVEGCSGYWADHNDLVTHFGDGESYNLYFLMNTTRFIGDDWKAGELDLHSEANLASLTYAVDSYSVFNTTGFPMAGVYKNWVSGVSPRNFELDRQIARVVLRLHNVTQENIHLTVTGVRLHQAARKIRPFGTAYAASIADDVFSDEQVKVDATLTDHNSTDDLAFLQEENEAIFYVLENAQGNLLSDNDNPWGKTPESVENSDDPTVAAKAGLVTYMEVECSATTQASTVGRICYNVCLGIDNKKNFDLFRNEESTLDISYDSYNITDHKWKQTSEQYKKVGYYEANKTIAKICPGIDDFIIISSVGRDNFIEIDPNRTTFTGDTDGITYSVERIDNKYKISFSTSDDLIVYTAHFEPGVPYSVTREPYLGINDVPVVKDAFLTLYSKDAYNDVPNASIQLRVSKYNDIFPIQFRYNKNNGCLEARSNNPMGLGFIVSYDGTVDGASKSGSQIFVNGRLNTDETQKISTSLNKTWKPIGELGFGLTKYSLLSLDINIEPVSVNTNLPIPYGDESAQHTKPYYVPESPCFKEDTEFYGGYGRDATFYPGISVPDYSFGTGTGYYENIGQESGSIGGNDESISYGILYGVDGRHFAGLQVNGVVSWADSNWEAKLTSEYRRQIYQYGYEGWSGARGCPFRVINADTRAASMSVSGGSASGVTTYTVLLRTFNGGRDFFPSSDISSNSYLGSYYVDIHSKAQLFNHHIWTSGGSSRQSVVKINSHTTWPDASQEADGEIWDF